MNLSPTNKAVIMSVSIISFLFYEALLPLTTLPPDAMVYTGPGLLTLVVVAFYLLAMYAVVVHGGDADD